MTTIAYKDNVIAADKQLTFNNNWSCATTTKIAKRGKLLAGAAGSTAQCQLFLKWFLDGCKGSQPEKLGDDFKMEAFIVLPDNRIAFFDAESVFECEADFFAIGSGEQFAIGAMEAGANAIGAIYIASKFDLGTSRSMDILRRE